MYTRSYSVTILIYMITESLELCKCDIMQETEKLSANFQPSKEICLIKAFVIFFFSFCWVIDIRPMPKKQSSQETRLNGRVILFDYQSMHIMHRNLDKNYRA